MPSSPFPLFNDPQEQVVSFVITVMSRPPNPFIQDRELEVLFKSASSVFVAPFWDLRFCEAFPAHVDGGTNPRLSFHLSFPPRYQPPLCLSLHRFLSRSPLPQAWITLTEICESSHRSQLWTAR